MNINAQQVLVQNGQELDGMINGLKLSVVLIYASWCPFCTRFLATFKKYADGKVNFLFAQDDQEILAEQYNVEIVPTVLYFKNGSLIARLDGAYGVGLNESQLKEFLKTVGA